MLDEHGQPLTTARGLQVLHFAFVNAPAGRLHYLSERIVAALEHWDWCVLWITLWGVWASSENMHLYHRLRQSYGDLRHLAQAPVHYALRHETFDMSTLVHLVMMNGWDAHLFTSHDYARVALSHDEYCQIAVPPEVDVQARRGEMMSWKVDVDIVTAAV